jgi:type II secretory ATPase GspE/PulE/Tfp pilus assembly ATPase PilB-like protein
VGCAKCGGSGYKGRLATAEALEVSDGMSRVIMKGYDLDAVEEELKRQKFVSIRQDGMLKALAGLTTVEEVIRATAE